MPETTTRRIRRKKTRDPRLIALEDKARIARDDFERWYRKLKRAMTGCEKAKGRLQRLQRRIDRFGQPSPEKSPEDQFVP